jgi:cytochrome c oxidase cbb3-type subunit III
MSGKRETDPHSGMETTGHEWDGITELDTPLPRWWLWIFWATVLFSVGYWVLMPSWPYPGGYTRGLLHDSARVQVVKDLAALKAQRDVEGRALANASLEQIEKDPTLQTYAMTLGQLTFNANCAACHGTGGIGSKGYANLRDDVWLWGGKLEDIQQTITHGVRADDPETRTSKMPSFGQDQLLKPGDINDLTEYVMALSHRTASAAAVARAAPLFQTNCAACHGPDGKGNQAFGAPNLTDSDWLYGGDRASIHDQIWFGRAGVMPAWGKRFDANTIKALTVYIHANAGGS